MKYVKLDIKADHHHVDEVTNWIMDFGITSMEIKDNRDINDILEKETGYEYDYVDESLMELDPHENPIITIYLSPEDENMNEILNKIMSGCNADGSSNKEEFDEWVNNISFSVVDDSQWKNSYKEHFKTTTVGNSIVMVPSWEEDDYSEEKYPGRKPIFMDPGMAFGTGNHPTTTMCAEYLEEVGCENKNILDVGTGTGILAIIADKLGAKDIIGIEIDPEAVAIAKENVEKNNSKAKIVEGDLVKGLDYSCDVVVANLMAEFVVDLAGDIKKHMNENGAFIASGILLEKLDFVKEGLKNNGLEVVDVKEDVEWCAILAK